ncbi:hypothetical protein [Georgenia sp. SUBG003]|uniref:hypothetical protein n=1 Tax=Georgenia sp. SUBG003 TaxID=1497974 RepID=UPI003AB6756F
MRYKTSYNRSDQPVVGLLVRRPTGTWDNLREVDDIGTRGIVQLDESTGTLRVLYTESTNYDDILMKAASVRDLAFPDSATTVMDGNFNNVTSTRENVGGGLMVMASSVTEAHSTLLGGARLPIRSRSPTPNRDRFLGRGARAVAAGRGGGDDGGRLFGPGQPREGAGHGGVGPGAHGVLAGARRVERIRPGPGLRLSRVSGAMTVAAWVRPQALVHYQSGISRISGEDWTDANGPLTGWRLR